MDALFGRWGRGAGEKQSLPDPLAAAAELSYKGLRPVLPGRAGLWTQADWLEGTEEPSL